MRRGAETAEMVCTHPPPGCKKGLLSFTIYIILKICFQYIRSLLLLDTSMFTEDFNELWNIALKVKQIFSRKKILWTVTWIFFSEVQLLKPKSKETSIKNLLVMFFNFINCFWYLSFKGVFGVVEDGLEESVKFYNQWLEEVKQTVPKDRLLIFNPKQGWKPLCEFLEVPIPENPFPTNSGKKILSVKVFPLCGSFR